MATTKLTDEGLLSILNAHPHLRDRIASIVGVVENSDGTLEEADVIEERVVEELRFGTGGHPRVGRTRSRGDGTRHSSTASDASPG